MIYGASGPFAGMVNGEYDLIPGKLHNDRPVFRHSNLVKLRWLAYMPNGRWAVQDALSKQSEVGSFAFVEETGLALPHEAKTWKILDDTGYVPAADLRVFGLDGNTTYCNVILKNIYALEFKLRKEKSRLEKIHMILLMMVMCTWFLGTRGPGLSSEYLPYAMGLDRSASPLLSGLVTLVLIFFFFGKYL